MGTKFSNRPNAARSILAVCLRCLLIGVLLLLTLGSKQPGNVQAMSWPTSTPEAQGINSNDLIGMLDWIEANQYNVHSILIMRHGKLVMEAYYPPFTRQDIQMQFSGTKSFLSALFGIAVGEGKIQNINQSFLNYFQDVPIQNMSEWKQQITILDLLNMTSGLEMCDNYMDDYPDPVQTSLDKPVHFEPGTDFEYNPCNAIILADILEKATGMRAYDYGEVKLFKPLGIKDVFWASYGTGLTQGNVGLMVNARDMLKFGMLYLQNGVWEGRQVIPADWVAATFTMNDKGYGYQWWQGLGGIGASGYSGQRIFVFPQQDIVIVITAEVPEEWIADNLAITPLFAICSDEALPESPASALLAERIWDIEHPLSLDVPPLPSMATAIDGKTIRLEDNLLGWKTARLEFKKKYAYLHITTQTDANIKKFTIGLNGIYRGTMQKAVPEMIMSEPPQRYNLNPFEFNFVLGTPIDGITWMKGAWLGEDTFTLIVQDSRDFDLDTLTFHFSPPGVTIDWFSDREQATQMTFQGQIH